MEFKPLLEFGVGIPGRDWDVIAGYKFINEFPLRVDLSFDNSIEYECGGCNVNEFDESVSDPEMTFEFYWQSYQTFHLLGSPGNACIS